MSKVTELIKNASQFCYSFEITPDVNIQEIDNLEVEPVFFSVTWHAKSHQCRDYNIPPLQTVEYLRRKGKQVLMHLSCDLLKINYLDGLLIWLQEKGVHSLFVILGENYDPSLSDFKTSLELLRYIKDKTGDYFCIGIAGLPDCEEEKILQIKDKVNSGADFIITQAFYDPNIFKTFLEKCGKVGINVPVLPGVFYFETRNQLIGFMNMCKIKVSADLMNSMQIEVDKPGVEVVRNLINSIQADFPVANFHFFTLNKLQSISSFLKCLHAMP